MSSGVVWCGLTAQDIHGSRRCPHCTPVHSPSALNHVTDHVTVYFL